MSSNNALNVGTRLRIQYDDVWCPAEIIQMTKDTITVKLWQSSFKSKLFDISRREDWIFLVGQKKIFKDEMNISTVPKWLKIRQTVCVLDEYGKAKYGRIADYSSIDNSVSIISLIQNDSGKIKLKIKKYKHCSFQSNIINTRYISILPEYHKIDNKYLMKKLLFIKQHQQNTKSCSSSTAILKTTNLNADDIEHYHLKQYINNEYSVYKHMLNTVFPEDVTQIIQEYALINNMIFICPPSPFKKCKLSQYKGSCVML